MDKEKIEEMAKVISKAECYEDKIAEALINAGYGNVKEAIKEFATFIHGLVPIYKNNPLAFHREIDKKIKEFYDEKQE